MECNFHPVYLRKPLSKIANFDEINKNPLFPIWREIVSGSAALCGLDYIDVYTAVKDKVCFLSGFSANSIELLGNKISFDGALSNAIIVVNLPKEGFLDEAMEIVEIVKSKLPFDCSVIYQVFITENDIFEVVVLTN